MPFSLFCAYPEQLFVNSRDAGAFASVCDLHSNVVGAAPEAPGSEVTRRFARTPQAPRLARLFVSETLHRWDRDDLMDDAALVVTELAANAIVHAGSDVAVGLLRLDDGIRLVVGDTSGVPPARRGADPTAFNGRGLLMVSEIARRWGHEAVDGGKLVWVDLGTGTVSPSA